MKKTLVAIAVFVAALCVVSQSYAVPLAIDGEVTLTSQVSSPGVGAALASLSTTFKGLDSNNKIWFTGTLNQWVRANSDGFLVFEYEIISDSTSSVRIKLADITDWNGFSTDVGIFGGVLPDKISRETPGSAISYEYNAPAIAPGQSSGLIWVETNTKAYQLNGTTQLQGTGNTRIRTYAPTTPEPSSVALLGMGLVGFVGMIRRKFMA